MLRHLILKIREFLLKIKKYFRVQQEDYTEEGYVELEEPLEEKKEKILVKTIILEEKTDINGILNSLREGKSIVILDIKDIKERDFNYVKKVVYKLKKLCHVTGGDIVSVGENFVVVTPAFARVHRNDKRYYNLEPEAVSIQTNVDEKLVKKVAEQVAKEISKNIKSDLNIVSQVTQQKEFAQQKKMIEIKTDYDFPVEDETKGLKSNIDKIGVKLEKEKSDIDRSVGLLRNVKK